MQVNAGPSRQTSAARTSAIAGGGRGGVLQRRRSDTDDLHGDNDSTTS